ncbi:uncharacterized protein LOC115381268 [Salarias fasciatus]|uniref:uncharacterized protein LOC115381268 n=1 Tax=Salarias fasciatus TaxID=181472 RepID=UPI0011768442|nr:uncharacterized protein LOC115381268 [Salarias fasciatus]
MAAALHRGPRLHPLVVKADRIVSDLREDIRRLSEELREKDDLLEQARTLAEGQSMIITSFMTTTAPAPWAPSCSTPDHQRSWAEVVVRGHKPKSTAALPPLPLSNRFHALAQYDSPAGGEGPRPAAAAAAPASSGGSAARRHDTPEATPPNTAKHCRRSATALDRYTPAPETAPSTAAHSSSASEKELPAPELPAAATDHSAAARANSTSASEKELPAAVPEKDVPAAAREPGRSPPVPERRRSPRTAASAARLRLIREAVRRHSVSHHRGESQNQGQDHRSGSEVAAGGVAVPAERSPALGADTAAPDTHDVAPQPPPPRPLFSPTTLLVGDSSIRNIRFFNAITRCIPGATVPTILHDLPELLQSLPSTVRRVIVHVGTNDTARRQSETTCLLDPIPTPLFKSLYGFLEEQILNIMNSSLQTGVFPTAFKTAVVKPLLKKSNLDPDVFNNYRPVSNLPFLSKVLERLVFNQVNDFLMINNILERHQSGFRVNHSTETALLKILNDIRWNLDNKKLTVMVLLDLSAAFDTVDHHILINRLSHLVGLSGTVLNWFSSYLTDRCFYVSLDTCSSGTHEIRCGVPQGSILGPILFNLYMLPLGDVIRRHGISFHSYADDTQLYIAVSPDDSGPIETLFNCISDIKSWMAVNFLQLNQDKTEVLVIGPEGQREKILPKLRDFKPAQSVKNLGVIFDSELNFIPHIKNITKIGFYHLKNIARVRPFLSQASTEVLMHAFISCRLDYCNALLSGLPKKNISNLQLLQNSAARVLTRTRGRAHITPVLQSLHWLPVRFRIDFKVLLLVFKCLNGLAPSYLADLFLPYRPSRALRSSGSALLCVPKARTKTHGEAAFGHYGPRLWNSLPENLRTAETVDIFKGRLKTHLFNQAFN